MQLSAIQGDVECGCIVIVVQLNDVMLLAYYEAYWPI